MPQHGADKLVFCWMGFAQRGGCAYRARDLGAKGCFCPACGDGRGGMCQEGVVACAGSRNADRSGANDECFGVVVVVIFAGIIVRCVGDWANRMGSWRDRDLRGIEERVGLVARSDDGSSSAIGVADPVRHVEIDDDGSRERL